jgi:hypothetical protein
MKKPKKPKRPKKSASLAVWENFDKRMREWSAKCKAIEAGVKRKKALTEKRY